MSHATTTTGTDPQGRTLTTSDYGTLIIGDYPDGTCGVCDGNGWCKTRTGGINCPRCNYPEIRTPLSETWIPYTPPTTTTGTLTYASAEWERIFVALGDTMERRELQYTSDCAWRDGDDFTLTITSPKLYAAIQALMPAVVYTCEDPPYVCPQPGCHAEAWTADAVSDHLHDEHAFGRRQADAAARAIFPPQEDPPVTDADILTAQATAEDQTAPAGWTTCAECGVETQSGPVCHECRGWLDRQPEYTTAATLTRAERALTYVNAHAYERLDACECASLLSALADVRTVIRSFSDLDIELHNVGR